MFVFFAGTPKDGSTPAPGTATPAAENSSAADGAGSAAAGGTDSNAGDTAAGSSGHSRALFEVELLLDEHSGGD
jgi:hypothetical protein